MSIDNCERCGEPVDTDFDLDFYFLTAHPKYPHKLCERCREQLGVEISPDEGQHHERSN